MRLIIIVVAIMIVMVPAQASAQSAYGQRLQSRDGQWMLPVASRILSSDEGDHVGRNSINAWDLSATVGTPVFAAAPGTVSYVDCFGYEEGRSWFHQGYGCAVDVNHGNGIVSQYAHCQTNSFYVKIDQVVDEWTVLCLVGTTGVTGWPHVHFDILKNGSAVRLDNLFDRSQMEYCKFCRSSNDPRAPIAKSGGAAYAPQVAQSTQPATVSRIYSVLAAIISMDTVNLFWMTTLMLFALMFILWISPNWLRTVIISGMVSMVCGVSVVLTLLPTQAATSSTAAMPTGGAFELAYQFTVASEGWEETDDGAYTMGGVTQGTYDRWRKSKGLPTADVKQHLTKDERKQIFYELYWMASGADRLPASIAITYVDHAFNAGVGAAKRGLEVCGTDAKCFNDWRYREYLSMSGCFKYCKGWLSRVNRVRTITEK